MSDIDDLPLIQCRPQPVPVGHPEHPDFRGYEDDPPPSDEYVPDADLADALADAWRKK